ncbi:MAG TPA: GNAT family N-acetyltransferase [Nitrospiraceae bacterium]|jgi:acyl homoserine lactone synthase|nr:GNAT family N-acetyltransferase [Nitrospiraceae bacterium]
MRRVKDVEFSENGFVVKTLHGEQLAQSYRLRHKVFAESLKWVPETEDRQEIDLYDLWATTVGLVRDDGAVVGVARLLPSSSQFMLEKEFGALLPSGYQIRKGPDTAEITRLAVDPEIRDRGLSSRMMLALLKGVYQWAVENDIRYYYLEVEHRFFRALRALGFPCEMIGEPVVLPPAGASSVAALYDMVRFDEENAIKKPQFLNWISSIETLQGEVIVGRTSSYANSERLGLVGAEA